jgi:hypothetical protein
MDDETEEKAAKGPLSVEDALKMFEQYKSYWEENYREANIDLKMVAGDPATHWGEAYNERKMSRKATLVINELPQFVHQVTNDIRQNTPSIDIIPTGDGDIETANIFADLIRGIEYKSSADEAYDTAAEYAVKCGVGFIRVDHDYVDDEEEIQELTIKKVPDPLSVWIDPASVECDGRDANGAIALEPISRADFERLYPKHKFISFTDPKAKDVKDSIVLGEVFIREWAGKRGKKATIHHYKFSGEEQIAYTTFPGDYVPYAAVFGEVVWIDGKRIVAGLVRQARDPQLRLNHWACKEQEILNMAPTAPILAVEGTIVNERKQWQIPGSENVLEYRQNDIDGNQAPAPTRLQPPTVPTGIINAMEGAKQNIKESLGMYNASIGEKSNETSGIAIQRRQHEGDVATYHFPDNTRRAVTQVGRIILSALPIVVDTPRIEMVMSEEEEPSMVGLNGAPMQPGQKQPYDLTRGKYHVRVTTGASFTTKRQEAAATLTEVFKQVPALMQVGGDLLFKNMDLPGMQALAERVKKTIPPQLLDENQQNADPRVAQMQQIIEQGQQQMQQMQQELAACQQELKSKQLEAQVKLEDSKLRAQVEMKKLESMGQDAEYRRLELILRDKELDIKAREVELKYPPRSDTEQAILEHSLDEQAADNQLQRDLIQQGASAAMQPSQPTEGATAAQ